MLEYERKWAILPPTNSAMASIRDASQKVLVIEDRYTVSTGGMGILRSRSITRLKEGQDALKPSLEISIKTGDYPARQEYIFGSIVVDPIKSLPALAKTRYQWTDGGLKIHVEKIDMHDGPLWILEAEGEREAVDGFSLRRSMLDGFEIPRINNYHLYLLQYDFRALGIATRLEYVEMRARLLRLALDCEGKR